MWKREHTGILKRNTNVILRLRILKLKRTKFALNNEGYK